MAQQRFFNWKEEDSTFLLSQRLSGFFTAGRYAGYDFTPTANMTLTLGSSVSGMTTRKITGSPYTVSVAQTHQGMTLFEDAPVTLPIGAVGGLPRIDMVVLTHSQTQNPGGALGLYSVVQGTPGATPVKPAIPTPDTQIEIGSLYLPASVTALNQSGVIWTQSKVSAMETKASNDEVQDVYAYIDSLLDSVWVDITLANGWLTNVGMSDYYGAQYKKQGNEIYLRGAIVAGPPLPSSNVFAENFVGLPFSAVSKQTIAKDTASGIGCLLKCDLGGNLEIEISTFVVNAGDIYLLDGAILHLD